MGDDELELEDDEDELVGNGTELEMERPSWCSDCDSPPDEF